MTLLPTVLVMCLLVGLSALFSGSETALFSLTAGQVHQLSASRHRLDHLVTRLLKEPDYLLITLLICNMVVNVVYFTLGAVATLVLAGQGASPLAITAWAVGVLVALVLLGEVAPKALAFAYNTRVASLASLPLFLIDRTLRPLNRLLRGSLVRPLTRLAHVPGHVGIITVDELRDLLAVSERRGILHADETMMLHEIIGLGQVKVRDVMVPRVELIAFEVSRPRAELVDLLRRCGRAKLPVYRGDLDHIVGWASCRRVLLEADRPLGEMLAPVLYAADVATVEQLLQEFRRNKANAAIVVDEYGGTAGLVTIRDVLAEIIGEIQDRPADGRRPLVQQVGPVEYSVAGQLPIHDWAEAFGHELDDPRLITVAGLVVKLLGRLPKVGDKAAYRNVTFEVESMSKRRIERLRLTLEPGGEPPP